MSGTATLEITRYPDLGENGRLVVIDCEHGTTTAAIAEGEDTGAVRISDEVIARIAVARHFDTERYACTVGLPRRYGVT